MIVAELWKQAVALDLAWDIQAEDIQNRRHKIDERDWIGNRARGGIAAQFSVRRFYIRHFDDQWNVHRRVIDEESVSLFSVLAQAFAVVTREH